MATLLGPVALAFALGCGQSTTTTTTYHVKFQGACVGVLECTTPTITSDETTTERRLSIEYNYLGRHAQVRRGLTEHSNDGGALRAVRVEFGHQSTYLTLTERGALADEKGALRTPEGASPVLTVKALEERAFLIASASRLPNVAEWRVFGLDVDQPRLETVRIERSDRSRGKVAASPLGAVYATVERDVGIEVWSFDRRGALLVRSAVSYEFGRVEFVRSDVDDSGPAGDVVDITRRWVPKLQGESPDKSERVHLVVSDARQFLSDVPETSEQQVRRVSRGEWRISTGRPVVSRAPLGSRRLEGHIEERWGAILKYTMGLRLVGMRTSRAVESGIRAHVRYTEDSPAGDARSVLEYGEANCVGMASLAGAVAVRLGYEVRVVFGVGCVEDADGAELIPHRWVEIREGDDWETVDPSDGGTSAWRLAFRVWDFVESTSWPDGVRATSQLDLSGVVVRYAIK